MHVIGWLFLKESGLVVRCLFYRTFLCLFLLWIHNVQMFIVSNNKLNSISVRIQLSHMRWCTESGNYSFHLVWLLMGGNRLVSVTLIKGQFAWFFWVRLESTVHTVGRPKKSASRPADSLNIVFWKQYRGTDIFSCHTALYCTKMSKLCIIIIAVGFIVQITEAVGHFKMFASARFIRHAASFLFSILLPHCVILTWRCVRCHFTNTLA